MSEGVEGFFAYLSVMCVAYFGFPKNTVAVVCINLEKFCDSEFAEYFDYSAKAI